MLRALRSSLVFVPFLTFAGCTEVPPLRGCERDIDCPDDERCVNTQCVPIDSCGAGFYDGTNTDGARQLVEVVEGSEESVRYRDGAAEVVQTEGGSTVLGTDFWNNSTAVVPVQVFAEARLRVEEGGPCAAALSLWPDRARRARICIGDGRVGIPTGPNNAVKSDNRIDDLLLTDYHVYRLVYLPAQREDTGVVAPDAGTGGTPATPATGDAEGIEEVELWVDGELRWTVPFDEFDDTNTRLDRAPIVRFGAYGTGTTFWDYLRWGCNPDGGTCVPSAQDADQCEPTVQVAGCRAGRAGMDEECNGEDDDCDGEVDENFSRGYAAEHEGDDPQLLDARDFEVEAGLTGLGIGDGCPRGVCTSSVVICESRFDAEQRGEGTRRGLKCDVIGVSLEICDGLDNNCDGQTDEGYELGGQCWKGQGACRAEGEYVCDQADRTNIACNALEGTPIDEVCGNDVDDDCDGQTDEGFDIDNDLFTVCGRVCGADQPDCEAQCGEEDLLCPRDCDDGDALVNPDASEICDGYDNDCDGETDEGVTGPVANLRLGVCAGLRQVCGGLTGWEEPDYNSVEGYNVREQCDGLDNTCDGRVDEGFDSDLDGYTECGRVCNEGEPDCVRACGADEPDCPRDCDDTLRAINPEARETCDGRDNNCDGQTDEDLVPVPAGKTQGVCEGSTKVCAGESGWQEPDYTALESYDLRERCDGLDNNCDGLTDEGLDSDLDGYTECGRVCNEGEPDCVRACPADDADCPRDCDEAARAINPEAIEVCDGLDNDCDGETDEGLAPVSAAKTLGVCEGATKDCSGEGGWVEPNYAEHSADYEATETRCDGVDNDCNGLVDDPYAAPDNESVLIYNHLRHCGSCRNSCAELTDEGELILTPAGNPIAIRRNSVAACVTGVCSTQCLNGYRDVDEDDLNGCECEYLDPETSVRKIEVCNGLDDDCDGETDENTEQPCFDGDEAVIGVGVCVRGEEFCLEDGSDYGECVGQVLPTDEICDGLDNDCDRAVDEELEGLGPLSDIQEGVCLGAKRVCGGPGGWVEPDYSDQAGHEAEEQTCDGLDNDCNGIVDDPFTSADPVNEGQRIYDDPEHCGRCDNSCAEISALNSLNYKGDCRSDGSCTTECKSGFVDGDQQPDNGCEVALCTEQSHPGLGEVCTIQSADLRAGCLLVGVSECALVDGATQLICQVSAPEKQPDPLLGAEPEICDGTDNDCDGEIDDGLVAPPATLSVGVCGGLVQTCTGIAGWADPDYENDGIVGYEAVEATCDGLDNDCDGETDESVGPRLANEQAGVCAGLEQVCAGVAEWVEPNYEDEQPLFEPVEMSCDGLDNDCNGAADDPWPELTQACTVGTGICASTGVWICNDAGDGVICSATIRPGAVEICDGVDNDCDGTVDLDDTGQPLQRPCYTGPVGTENQGLCLGGTETCGAGEYGACEGEIVPAAEICDHLDNDCDGDDDEDFDLLTDVAHCGGCDLACEATVANPETARLICVTAVCRIAFCLDGFVDQNLDDTDACEYPCTPDEDGIEDCDGLDDDCDGDLDEDEQGDPLTRACYTGPDETRGIGECGDGIQTCQDGSYGVLCPGQTRPQAAELCDGLDNNCDGGVDEEFPTLGAVCDVGRGECVRSGIGTCSADGLEVVCDGTPANGVDELCDGLDNNCDGRVDETFNLETDPLNCGFCNRICTFSNATARCSGGECALGDCEGGFFNADGREDNGCECQHNNGGVEAANGIDDDCDGQVDNCDSVTHSPCDEQSNVPICDPAETACRACRADAECVARPGSNQECVDGRCRACDPADHARCDEGAELPICDVGSTTCRACAEDAECQSRPGDLNECVVGVGCRACDPDDHAGCDEVGATPICDGDSFDCRACGVVNGDTECASRPGDRNECVAGECQVCDVDDHAGCTEDGATPICDAGTNTCRRCTLDAECVDRPGKRNACSATGTCETCEPIVHDGCAEDSATPICDADTLICRGCLEHAECAGRPGDLEYCDDGECVLCEVGTNNGCAGVTPYCDRRVLSNEAYCRGCGNSDECGGVECVDDECQGCNPTTDAPCDAEAPICDDGTKQCRLCADDTECLDRPGDDDQCVDGRCRACDPADHEGCAPDRLCCDFACQGTDPAVQCEGCGIACDISANACGDRLCECGGAPACDPPRSLCDPTANPVVCVQCRDNGDCVGLANVWCVDGLCEVCDSANHDGCVEASGTPICDVDALRCRACAGDGECQTRPGDLDFCVAGLCEACDPADHTGCDGATRFCVNGACGVCRDNDDCDPLGATPICGADQTCVACADDLECAGRERGSACDQVNGDCECIGEGAPCGGATPYCVADVCVACRGVDDCGDPGLPYCQGGACVECEGPEHCASAAPVCDGFECRTCGGNAECTAIDGALGICVRDGTCQRCDSDDNDGCAGGTPTCVDDAACQACDPADNEGCDAQSLTPVCGKGAVCRACADNPECAAIDAGRPVCSEEGSCQACDTVNHEGCNANELCCAFACAANAANDSCTACGVPCGVDSDTCTDRVCGCGGGAACSGDTPYCVGAVCVACRDIADCGGDTPACVLNACRACDGDEDCGDATPFCVSNDCRECRNGDDCDPRSTEPVCGGNNACGACTGDGECAAKVAGNVCDLNTGNCDCPATGAPCFGATPFCSVDDVCVECVDVGDCPNLGAPLCDGGACVECAGDGDCGDPTPACVSGACEVCDTTDDDGCNAPTPICVGGAACAECDPADHSGCDAQSALPLCDAGTSTCRRCADNDECLALDVTRGVCVADGSCKACDTVDHDGCGAEELCCNDVCEATIAASACADCNTGCGDESDACTGRTCVCGGGAACAPGTPYCEASVCVECRDAGDCSAPTAVCDGGTCVACAADGDCVGDEVCVSNQCVECRDDAQCANPTPICSNSQCVSCTGHGDCSDPTPYCEEQACVACLLDRDCGVAATHCIGGECLACNPNNHEGCADPSPICTAAGACVVCDLDDHDGCGDAELCCDGGGGPECVATSTDDCTGCGVACGVDADACTNRSCGCGAGEAACADPLLCKDGTCVECLDVGQCSDPTPACVDNRCQCLVDDTCGDPAPHCLDGACVECLGAPDCAGPGDATLCLANACVECGVNADCDFDPNRPVCDASNICVGCDKEAEECTDVAAGNICVVVEGSDKGSCGCGDGAGCVAPAVCDDGVIPAECVP